MSRSIDDVMALLDAATQDMDGKLNTAVLEDQLDLDEDSACYLATILVSSSFQTAAEQLACSPVQNPEDVPAAWGHSLVGCAFALGLLLGRQVGVAERFGQEFDR